MLRFAIPFLIVLSSSLAQTAAQTPSFIQASGSATVAVQPDQAQLSVSVTTQAGTAQDAGQQNANQTAAVIAALKSALGSTGSIQTAGYSIYPRYGTPAGNQVSVIVGYSATNSLSVTTNDLTNIGKLIDVANQAGATSVGGVSLGLQNPEPFVQQALAAAAKQAMAHASAIAVGLAVKTGAVISAIEGSSYAPVVSGITGAAAGVATPIQTGTVSVSANVTLTVTLN